MQIGTFFSHIDQIVRNSEAKNIGEAFEVFVSKGLSFVDVATVMLTGEYGYDYKASALRDELKEYGVYVGSVYHMVPFDYKDTNILVDMKNDTVVQLERCAQLGCNLFMPVPQYAEPCSTDSERSLCRDRIVEYINKTAEISKKYGRTTVVENYSNPKYPFSTVEDITYIMDNAPEVSYVLDTGNFWFNNSDVLRATELFIDKTKHVHLKDILPKENGYLKICSKSCDSVAMGDGVIPFEAIFEKLKHFDYNKGVTIEINDYRELTLKIKKSIEYLHRLGI